MHSLKYLGCNVAVFRIALCAIYCTRLQLAVFAMRGCSLPIFPI